MLFNIDTTTAEQRSAHGSVMVEGKVYAAALSKDAKAHRNLEEILPPYAKDQVITFLSDDSWSLHVLAGHYLQHTGPADIYLSSWTITEDPVRSLLRWKELGLIRSMNCLLDYRIKTLSAKPFQLLQSIVTRQAFTKIHAKVFCIRNHSHHVAIVGSANLSRNRRKEAGVIFTDSRSVDFHINWIKQVLDESER